MTAPGQRRLWRALLALGGGLALYAGHPPLDVALAGPLAPVPLLLLAADLVAHPPARPVRAAAGYGLFAGCAFFLPLLSWVSRFGIVAWAGLAVVQAAFVAAFLVGVVAWGSWRLQALAVVVWWVALEALRSIWPLGGFAWGVLGYTQHDGGLLLPVARAAGVLGVSALCVAVAVTLTRLVTRPRGAILPGLFTAALFVAGLVAAGRAPAALGRTLDIAAVQGNDIQSTSAAGVARVDTGRIVSVAQRMVEATAPLAAAPQGPPEVTIWPENSLDADIRDPDNVEVRRLAGEGLALVGPGRLFAGAYLDGPRPGTLYNSEAEVTGPGTIGQNYRKRQPVPFGEYVPARGLLGWIPALDQIPQDTLPGNKPGVLRAAGAVMGAVICFENVFPELVHSQVRAGAELLIVSTNNASYGRTAMSRQHLAFSQVRAVETGRWVLHAGISGISGIIDPAARVHQRTKLFAQAVVRDDVPLVEGQTLATRLGDWPARVVMALALAGLIVVVATSRLRRGR